MEIAMIIGAIVLFLGFWIAPVVLGIRAAAAKGVSPHWMWFGLHPFGAWIAFLVIRFGVRARMRCPQCAETLLSHAKVCAYCGHPLDGTSGMSGTPNSASTRRIWVLVLAIAAGFVLFVGVFVLTIFAMVSGAFDHSDVVRQALLRAQNSSTLQSTLGTPIEKHWAVSGSINESGPSGNADLDIPLRGPKGSGDLFVVASKSAGTWSFTTLDFQAKGSSGRIDLLQEHSQSALPAPTR